MNLVSRSNGQAVTDSQTVAATFKKEHKHVIRDIEKLIEDTESYGEKNFTKSEYIDALNRKKPCYTMTKDGFTLLAMGYGTKKALQFKIAYIEQFNAMEKEIRSNSDLLAQLGRAHLEYKRDSEIASECGRVLQAWKGKKKKHNVKIKAMEKRAQISFLN